MLAQLNSIYPLNPPGLTLCIYMCACILQDRFAIDRYLPSVDESQDWFLVSGVEENGYTILEFTRKLTTCDDKDLTIKVAA